MDSGSRLSRTAGIFIRTFGVARAGTIELLEGQRMKGLLAASSSSMSTLGSGG